MSNKVNEWIRDPSGNVEYYLDTNRKVYEGAKNACINIGGILASVKSNTTQLFIEDLILQSQRNHSQTREYWIGAHRIPRNNKWLWEDGSPLNYSNWEKNEDAISQSSGESEDCASIFIRFKHRWFSNRCNATSYGYICERQILGSTMKTVNATSQFLYPTTPSASSQNVPKSGATSLVKNFTSSYSHSYATTSTQSRNIVLLTTIPALFIVVTIAIIIGAYISYKKKTKKVYDTPQDTHHGLTPNFTTIDIPTVMNTTKLPSIENLCTSVTRSSASIIQYDDRSSISIVSLDLENDIKMDYSNPIYAVQQGDKPKDNASLDEHQTYANVLTVDDNASGGTRSINQRVREKFGYSDIQCSTVTHNRKRSISDTTGNNRILSSQNWNSRNHGYVNFTTLPLTGFSNAARADFKARSTSTLQCVDQDYVEVYSLPSNTNLKS